MSLGNQMECLIRAQKAYEKAHREAEKALENYQKADADLHLSRAEVIIMLILFYPINQWLFNYPVTMSKKRQVLWKKIGRG